MFSYLDSSHVQIQPCESKHHYLQCDRRGHTPGVETEVDSSEPPVVLCVPVVSVESREAHLSSLVVEAEQRAADLSAQAQKDGLSLEACHKDKQLRAWEWRSKLYKRMRTGFQHARKDTLKLT